MKSIILVGGLGSRLGEITNIVPKPMVKIGSKPILLHIMKYISKFNLNDFYLALGYKSEVIIEYFLKFREINSDFSINLKTGKIKLYDVLKEDWNIHLINTGLDSMTGGRVKKMKQFIGNETFLLTYGDGLSNIDLNKLIEFHKSHKKLITISAVHPSARFGELDIVDSKVKNFKEKPQTKQGWINGGYFIVEPGFFDYLDSDETILEKEPLEKAAMNGELMAFRHDGFWQCMDTKRDLDYLNNLWTEGKAPWDI